MRIAILSLNPRHNYGGILQSYALKKVLEEMGHEVQVICNERKLHVFGFKQIVRWPYRALLKLTLKKDVRIFRELYVNRENSVRFQNTDRFIDKYLNPKFIRSYKEIKENEFDVFIVGSDQVWRPKYMGTCILDAYLNFARNWNIKRIAYAASFGVNEWEYEEGETKKCAQLLKNFDAVSVREVSGVELCKEHFGVDVIQLCDPTLLLSPEDYISLIPGFQHLNTGILLVYNLYRDFDFDLLVDRLSKEKGLVPHYILNREAMAPVEMWIQSFMDADFVLTDSFHGCIFSLIFRKPFLVFGNNKGGISRIESLLSTFGQTQRLVMSANDYNEGCNAPSYKNIDEVMKQLHNSSFQFLKDSLEGK